MSLTARVEEAEVELEAREQVEEGEERRRRRREV